MKRTWMSALVMGACAAGCAGEAGQEDLRPGRATGLRAVAEVDGVELSSEELEIELVAADATQARLVSPGASRAARPSLAGAHQVATPARLEPARALAAPERSAARAAATCGPDQPAELQAIGGNLCWQATTTAAGALVNEQALSKLVYFTGQGLYHGVSASQNLYVPPDLYHQSIGSSVGCIKSPNGATVSLDYLASLESLSVSTGFFVYSAGFTVFLGHGKLVRGVSYDSGMGASLSLLPFMNFSISREKSSSWVVPPTRLSDPSCQQVTGDGAFAAADGESTFQAIADGLSDLSRREADDYRGTLRREAATSMLPLVELLAAETGTGPRDGAPAATNADLFADMLGRDGTELCGDCSDTSLDALLSSFDADLASSDGSAEALAAASGRAMGRLRAITPELLRQVVTTQKARGGLALAYLVHEDLAAEARGDDDRFVAPGIEVIEGMVGDTVAMSVSAEEIAQLVGAAPAAIEGATVTIDGAPYVEPASFALIDGSVDVSFEIRDTAPYLFVIDVDLSTAAGPFADDASAWTVRPALRRVEVAPGAPARALLTGPGRVAPGTEVVLNAMVTDEHYNPSGDGIAVTFLDGEDRPLGESRSDDGIASLRVTPTPSTPVIAALVPVTLTLGDGSEVPGFEIAGSGFSRDAQVWIDGQSLADSDAAWAVDGSRSILVTEAGSGLLPGQHTLRVENPEGISSEERSLEVE